MTVTGKIGALRNRDKLHILFNVFTQYILIVYTYVTCKQSSIKDIPFNVNHVEINSVAKSVLQMLYKGKQH